MAKTCITLEATANIQQVATVLTEIRGLVAKGQIQLEIDATQTQRIDTAMIQLLCALAIELKALGGKLDLTLSDAVNRNIQLIGLAPLMECA
ncbi:MAG: STAS domain-containing protein [Thiotrichales bacterium]